MKYHRLVLVGNGFDLALGLKAQYSSFLLDLLKTAVIKTLESRSYTNSLFEMHRDRLLIIPDEGDVKVIKSISKIADLLGIINDKYSISVDYHSKFFEELLTQFVSDNWVDVEALYFRKLTQIYESYSTDGIKLARELNDSMDRIETMLNDYLSQCENSISQEELNNSPVRALIKQSLRSLSAGEQEMTWNITLNHPPKDTMILNFNYTKMARKLIRYEKIQRELVLPIHGELNSPDNPIIFGYGDDTTDLYRDMEMSEANEFLRKIKSFQYSRNDTYHKLLNFIDATPFEVFVVGHSCGLSDKTMLSTIFEHDNCKAIKVFHYQGQEEHFYKTMAISRHFTDKAKMRKRVLPFDPKATIPQTNS